jgi:DnaK suppressor protein
MSGINKKAFKKRLEQLREEVQRDSELTENERKPVALDQSMVGRLSRMDALQNQAMALEAERRRGVELQRIDAALARIEEGEFGCCAACGDDIGSKRLAQDPTVPNCITCARGAD